MKKIIICIVALILGTFATQVFGQSVQGPSVIVQPPGYSVRVDVPHYYRVQPQPYVVTPIITPPPPKPLFWTPFRNAWWRAHNPPRIHYDVKPYTQNQ